MTASLPKTRLETLRDHCGLEVFPQQVEQFEDLHKQTEIPRYRVRSVEREDCYEIVRVAMKAGKKVLWVTNTVSRCQAVACRILQEEQQVRLLCYHSRFRLRDRRAQHEKVIAAFQRGSEPVVAVTTQVCEMSLDLDADILITEAADVPALIQRMGRCCRQPIPAGNRVGEVHVYKPDNHLPYTPADIVAGFEFAHALAFSGTASQQDLADYLASLDSVRDMVGGFTGFLDSGWYAMARDDTFREDDDHTVDCVLDGDVAAYLQAQRERRGQEAGFVLPVPRRFARSDPRLRGFLQVAPGGKYDKSLGFLEKVETP